MSDGLASAASLTSAYDVALLDLDGVVYVGDQAVPHAVDAIAGARRCGMRCGFVTNNASRTPGDVAAHLREIGVPAADDDVVTSSQAGAHLLADRLRPGAPVLAVGGPGVAAALVHRGLRVVSTRAEAPEAVLQGFGRDVGWRELAEASLAVRDGAYWVATNLDVTLPVPGGRAPGNGMLVAAVAEAAGRRPDAVAGKPHAPLMIESVERLDARRPLVVGDRLDTDIEGAAVTGIDSLLVLTGVTGIADLLAARPDHRPAFVSADLRGLLEPHPEVNSEASGLWRARDSSAQIDAGSLRVHAGPGREGWEDAVRCACAAAWAVPSLDVTAATAALESSRPGDVHDPLAR